MSMQGVEVKQLGFRYRANAQPALSKVSVKFEPGKVHALVGENGAGKSTLFKLIAGMLRPDDGMVEAATAGLISQHASLLPELSVLQNFALVQPGMGVIDWAGLEVRAKDALAQLNVRIDLHVPVGELDAGAAQMIELARIIFSGQPVVLLDEPTAILDPAASVKLLEVLGQLAINGACVIFSSHRSDEVLAHAHKIHVLRHGILTMSAARDQIDTTQLQLAMFGKQLEGNAVGAAATPVTEQDEKQLKISGFAWRLGEQSRVLDLELAKGEALAIVGASGNGQQDLANALFFMQKPIVGEIQLNGSKLEPVNLKRQGMGRLPSQLQDTAAAMALSVAENLILHTYTSKEHSHPSLRLLRKSEIAEHAKKLINREELAIASGDSEFAWLSGGNQRKLLIARELEDQPSALVGHNVEAGLDSAAVATLVARLVAAKQAGTSLLLFAEDHSFVEQVADRIFLIDNGTLALLPRSDWQQAYRQHYC